jgi:hypothetical protein
MEKTVKLYIDCPSWGEPIKVDDFLISEGKTKTNSIYHVAEVKAIERPEKRVTRYYVKVFKSDLITALKRDPCQQQIVIIKWNNRNKK